MRLFPTARRTPRVRLAIILALGTTILPRLASASPLSMAPEAWQEKLFPPHESTQPPASPPEKEKSFSYTIDPNHGPTVVIGPWHKGRFSARIEYRTPISTTTARFHGLYRTHNLPDGATVYALYYADPAAPRIARRAYRIPPSPKWAPLDVTMRYPPAEACFLSVAVGLHHHTDGRVEFAALQLEPDAAPQNFPALPPDIQRPHPPTEGLPAESFFRTHREEDTWWFATPDGHAFYSRGTSGPPWRPGKRNDAAISEAIKTFDETGFNSLAAWTYHLRNWGPWNDRHEREGRDPVPLFVSLQSNTPKFPTPHLLDRNGRPTGMSNHAFPDPFAPEFERNYRELIASKMRELKGRPWFVGWFVDNEISHADLYRHVWSEHCSIAFRRFLEKRYGGEIAKLNAAWKSNYADFNALYADRPEPHHTRDAMVEDFIAFERRIVKRWIDTQIRCIRDADPDHMIFSNRFNIGGGLGDIRRTLDLHHVFDAIAVNLYPDNRQPGLSELERRDLEEVHRLTGLPLIIGEWSVPAMDSGLYDDPRHLDWSFANVVANQTQRARQTETIATQFYNTPWILGAHWFRWDDFDGPKRWANRGLFRAPKHPWPRLLEAFRNAHTAMMENEENAPTPTPTPSPTPPPTPTATPTPDEDTNTPE